jgi:hypothetical protein
MLTLFIFNRLSTDRKLAYLQQKGIFVGQRKRGDKSITVYMLSDSFVEVIVDTNTPEIPEHIQVFKSLKKLQEYLAEDARINSTEQ